MEHLPSIAALANFLILVGIIVYFARKPFGHFLVERSDVWKNKIEEADAIHRDAMKMMADYEQKISALDSTIEAIKSEALAAGEREKMSIIDRANRSAEKIIADAHAQGAALVANEKKRIQSEAMAMAIKKAGDDLASKMTDGLQDDWVNYFINEVEGKRVN